MTAANCLDEGLGEEDKDSATFITFRARSRLENRAPAKTPL